MHSLRILVGDDAAPLRAMFARIARGLGHDVIAQVPDSEAVLRAASELSPDVVIVDGRLPPNGALAILPRLRAAVPEAAIFVIAAISETVLVREALAAGATGAIARPLLADRVAASLSGKPPLP